MAVDLKPILNSFDAFGWIPTIRGALALDLMGDSKLMWGDVDRYSVVFSEYTGLSSQRYIAATTFHNVSDSKYGEDYVRSFRYFFYGSIRNNTNAEVEYGDIKQGSLVEPEVNAIKELTENEGILLGHLYVVLEETHTLSDLEVSIIKNIRNLVEEKKLYVDHFSNKAVSLEALETKRKELKRKWEIVCNDVKILSTQDRKVFHFGVLLTRDGIILLKDLTAETSKKLYFEEGTASDYTANIPIHRIFKTAMNFMKYLFHKNYHHEEEHDTFLPASNLHPYHKNQNFNRIFKHQIDSFLNPLMKLRRKGLKEVNLDATGILCYAKSFVYACRENSLISNDQAKKELDYLALQEAEIAHRSRHNRSLLNSWASQRSLFVIFSTILAFMVAALKIFESFLRISGRDVAILKDEEWYITIACFVGLAVIGSIIFFLSAYVASSKEFHINRAKRNKNRLRAFMFNRNSDLENKRLSKSLRVYMWIQDSWNEWFGSKNNHGSGKVWIQIIKILGWMIGCCIVILGILRLL